MNGHRPKSIILHGKRRWYGNQGRNYEKKKKLSLRNVSATDVKLAKLMN
jgi:hypothetical protein